VGAARAWWGGEWVCGSIHARWRAACLVIPSEHEPSNKELKLTKPALRDGASQLNSSVGQTKEG
jgi:hypothetical protein